MNARSIELVLFMIVRLYLQHVEQELHVSTLLKHLSWPLVLVRFLLLNIYLSRGYKLPTLPEKLSSRPVFIRVCVDQSLLCNSLSFLSYFF